jgi:tRNA nucleotidyltransferase/poly(A) polymerase
MDSAFEKARSIVERLRRAGYEAYFAGGCVRDGLLGLPPKDFDIATSALPEDVRRIFRRTIAVGAHFGVIVVVEGNASFDVATFRSDGAYGDGRRPDSVVYSSAVEDVQRRDFTINGLLYDPLEDRVIDHVGGRADLEARVVRTIGDPLRRFGEDHLRLLRAIRFAAHFDLVIAPETADAIRALAPLAARPSAERRKDELAKMLGGPRPARALELLEIHGLLEVVLPEVAAKAAQPLDARSTPTAEPARTALDRTRLLLRALEHAPHDAGSAWAVVLADLDPQGSYASARAAAAVMSGLRFSTDERRRIANLIAGRDRALYAGHLSLARRRSILASPDAETVLLLTALEARFAGGARRAVIAPIETDLPASNPLLGGDELIALGFPKGPAVRRGLRWLRALQWEERLRTPADARAWIAAHGARFGLAPRGSGHDTRANRAEHEDE